MFKKFLNGVLIIDPFKVSAEGLSLYIRTYCNLNTIDHVGSIGDLHEKAKEVNPRVIFVEPRIFTHKVADGIKHLQAMFPNAKVVIVDGYAYDEIDAKAMGADGFVDKLKPTSHQQIFEQLTKFGLTKNNVQKSREHSIQQKVQLLMGPLTSHTYYPQPATV